ncbi:MAG: S8 family serine peptidase [Actinomycetota bacterium]
MRALSRTAVACTVAFCLLGAAPVGAAPVKGATPSGRAQTVPGEVLVKMRPGISVAGAAGGLRARDAGPVGVRGWRLLKLPSGLSVDDALARLRGNPNVQEAGANRIYRSAGVTDDSLLDQEWGLVKSSATSAWSASTGSSAVIVGVVDTGVAADNPDLAPNMVAGATFVGGSTYDQNGHGTHVAGIIGAVSNDGFGVAGVAPHVRIMPLRALDANGSGTTTSIASAFAYAGSHGVKVVNASLGGSGDDPAMEDSIAGAPNTLFVFAAGNDGTDNDVAPFYPCASPAANIVCVAATDQADNLADFSNYGRETVDLAAPGVGIVSTYLPGGARNGSQMLSDSPSGPYQNGADSWAQTSIDLSGQTSCGLSYWLRGRVGPGDSVKAERSIDGGTTWSAIGSTFGPSSTTHGQFDEMGNGASLDADGSVTLLRFHLVADTSGTDDGVYIDDVSVQCASGTVWSDGFESSFDGTWTTGGTGNTWGTTTKAWTWVTMSGTSMATPFVSGAAALIWSYRPTTTVARAKQALVASVDHLAVLSTTTVSGGRLNVARALAYAADTTAPVSPSITGSAFGSSFQRSQAFAVGWKATDTGSGVQSYDVRYERASYKSGFGSWATWKSATPATSATFIGAAGYTYCFDVRARDRMGNTSGWSSIRCTAIPVNDRSLSASSGWSRLISSTRFMSTYSLSRTRYTTLRLYGASFKRIALIVTACGTCGKVQVFGGSKLYGTFSLSGTSQTRKIIWVKVLSSIAGSSTITIKVISSGAPVMIEGLGVTRV